MVRSHVTG